MSKLEAFYNDSSPWTPQRNSYPTYDNAVRYYMSRIYWPGAGKEGGKTEQNSPEYVMRDLALFCVGVWEAGDGCPKGWSAVVDQFKSAEMLML